MNSLSDDTINSKTPDLVYPTILMRVCANGWDELVPIVFNRSNVTTVI